jgi:hypothetical protein
MKNNMGLKGVTDAMQYCKSMMKSEGGSMMQPIKRYELGGTMNGPGDEDDPTKKRKCKMGQCGGSGGSGKIKSFVTNLFDGNNKGTGGKKNKPSLRRHRIR